MSVANRIDEDGRQPNAAIGESRVGGGHVYGRSVIGAQRHGGRRPHRSDPGVLRQIGHFVVADFFRDLDRRIVQRERQRVAECHVAVVLLFVVARLVNLVAVCKS